MKSSQEQNAAGRVFTPATLPRSFAAGAIICISIFFALSGCARERRAAPAGGTGVKGLTIERRILLGEGVSFGAAGSYEALIGKVHYTLDPHEAQNSRVTDAALAAGPDSLVHYSADIVIVKPTDIRRGNGVLFYNVVNRGNFDTRLLRATGWADVASRPSGSRERLGRQMKKGYTIVFSGWQDDVIADSGRLRLYAPEARLEGQPLPGEVLAVIETDSLSQQASLGDPGHRVYAVDPEQAGEAEMRVHDGMADPGTVIERGAWKFACPEDSTLRPDSINVFFPQGFEPGKIYTVRYQPDRSPLMGLCFPAVRDLIGFLSRPDSLNPLTDSLGKCPIRYRVAYGSSQCGRYLRNFIYQGFNCDLSGRRVFDGVVANVPGCRMGFFNYRYAQPSRSWGFYPDFVFPFTDLPSTDPVNGQSAGLLAGVPDSLRPKIFYIHHSGEYWSSGAALTHADIEGVHDVELPPQVRIYFLTGTAHGHAELENGHPAPGGHYYLPFNPNAANFLEAPLIESLARWVVSGELPPESAYPRLDRSELAALEMFSFPQVPDVEPPVLVDLHPRFDWGPRFDKGILDKALPGIGPLYPILVPAVDKDGNELAGLRSPHLAVPLASYTGWNYPGYFRSAATTTATRLSGAWLPFSRDRREREDRGDARPSLAERYRGRGDYLDKLRRSAEKLVQEKLMFTEDVPLILEQGGAMYDYVAAAGAWKPETAARAGAR